MPDERKSSKKESKRDKERHEKRDKKKDKYEKSDTILASLFNDLTKKEEVGSFYAKDALFY